MTTTQALLDLLDINHPSEHYTCIGYTKKGLSCRNPVGQGWRSCAKDELHQLCDALRDKARSVDHILLRLAELLHCRRWHQDQAFNVACRWKGRIARWNDEQENERQRIQAATRTLDRVTDWIAARSDTPQSVPHRASESSYTSADVLRLAQECLRIVDRMCINETAVDAAAEGAQPQSSRAVTSRRISENERQSRPTVRTPLDHLPVSATGTQTMSAPASRNDPVSRPRQSVPRPRSVTAASSSSVLAEPTVQQSRVEDRRPINVNNGQVTNPARPQTVDSSSSPPRPSSSSSSSSSSPVTSTSTPIHHTDQSLSTPPGVATPQSPVTPASSQATSEADSEECLICLLPLSNLDIGSAEPSSSSSSSFSSLESDETVSSTFSCGQCHIEIHRSCWNIWSDSCRERHVGATCIHCRLQVVEDDEENSVGGRETELDSSTGEEA